MNHDALKADLARRAKALIAQRDAKQSGGSGYQASGRRPVTEALHQCPECGHKGDHTIDEDVEDASSSRGYVAPTTSTKGMSRGALQAALDKNAIAVKAAMRNNGR